MINALIIEDEKTALENLLLNLKLTNEPINIVAALESIDDSIKWLTANPAPDLIFMDIQLKDGNSFSIFEQIKVNSPIIFTTAFDHYMVRAFEQTSIDYLLKPITEKDLSNSLMKYKKLQSHFRYDYNKLLNIVNDKETNKRSRIIVRRGAEFQPVSLENVVYFFTKNKVTFLVTNEGSKYLLDKNLKELEDELDQKMFYRANRKVIININFIKSYKPYDKIKLLVELTIPVSEEIIVSQENASDFKAWISHL